MLRDDSPDFVATHAFADRLLADSERVKGAVADSYQFATYVARSWRGIARSMGF
jgi:hypothetical protein